MALTLLEHIDRLTVLIGRGKFTPHDKVAVAREFELVKNRLASLEHAAHPTPVDDAPVLAIPVGDDPLPNNGQDPNVESYAKPDDFTRDDWFAKHGETIEVSFCKTATDFVRPTQALDELQKLVGPTLDQQSINVTKRAVVVRQQRWLDYFAGKLPFSGVASDFGSNYRYLGLVDLAAIHDLGA